MNHNLKFFLKALPAAIAALTPAYSYAQAGEPITEEVLVIGVGSRMPGRSNVELPVPVDTLTSETLEKTGHVEVGRMLQSLAPSFNFPSSSISDGTDALRPATLRGLGPDQTLVLINGKRRHQASLIHINTSVGRGTAGTDMNAIPAASIARIEVLRDGAAAQYGSDAIAGVINIVLKETDEGRIDLSYGEFSEGDGETLNLNVNKGFFFGSDGFVNLTANFRDRGHTNRAGLHGSCLFPGCVDTDMDGILEPGDPREVTAERTTFRIGDAESQQIGLALNASKGVGAGEVYGFLTYSSRDNESAAFFRHPGNAGGNPQLADGDAVIPTGFLPKINSDIEDLSLSVGYKIEFDNDATLDVSYTTGQNTIDYNTSDSVNGSFANFLRFSEGLSDADIRATIPRQADAYGLELGLSTLNIDYTQVIGQFGLAFGAELRKDDYRVTPGEAYAYTDYDTDANGASLFGNDASAGIQGFPGIGPNSAVDESRDVASLYADVEYDVTDDLLVSAAIRYDDYDGFGSTANYKLAASWAATDILRLRSAISTGFRAPSMQQLYFNNVGTQFVQNPADPTGPQIAVQRGTFRNDSALAGAIGIPALKEEESQNFSLGFVLEPIEPLTFTVDYYQIDINDRIVVSNGLGFGLSPTLDAALTSAGAGQGQFFLNGADTETSGVDIVITYDGIELGEGFLDVSLAGNFTKTDVVNLFTPVADIPADQIFSEQDVSIIEDWQPKDRISLNGYYSLGGFAATLAFNRYGEYTITDGGTQTYSPEIITDVTLNYSFDNGVELKIGANNLFDVTPDKNSIGNSRSGKIENGPDGDLIVSSPGVFTYSRRSAPFGFNGAFFHAGVSYNF